MGCLRSANLVSIIPSLQVLRQPFVECKRTRLCASVVDILRVYHEIGHASDGNHMSMVSLRHGRHELSDKQEVRNGAHIENFADFSFSFVKNGLVKARSFLISATAKELPANLSAHTHFEPSYRPWEQRMCVAPGGDFFKALQSGKASVATGHINTVTESGIRLKDGQTLDADIIITATGLKMQFLGNADLKVDGSEAIKIGHKFLWRGSMLQDVPNLAFFIGYTNASWTLGCDATARMFVRLMQDMRRRGVVSAVPKIADESKIKEAPMMNLSSGYIKVAMDAHLIPKCGDAAPWLPRRSYFLDSWFAKYGDISFSLVFKAGGKP